MAYGHGQTTRAADFNDLAASANALWGTGTGDRGYGQSNLSVPTAGTPAKGSDWTAVRTVLSNLCSWQNTATTLLPSSGSVAAGAVAVAFPTGETLSLPDLLSLCDTNRLSYQIGNMTLTSAAANTTRSIPWGFSASLTSRGGYGSVSGTQGTYTVIKVGTGSAWEATAYSPEVLPTLRVDFKSVASNHQMLGLCTNPAGATDYGAGYAFYNDWGVIRIYENYAHIGDFGTYDASTVFTITYDGSYIRYYVNGSNVHSTHVPGQLFGIYTAQYYLDSAYAGGYNSITYRPGIDANSVPYFIQGGLYVQYGSEDAARYFFNTGGELRFSFAHSSTATTQDSNWNSTLDNLVVAFRANSSAKLSGNGTTTTGLGYYQLTTGWQELHRVYGTSAYSDNVLVLYVRANTITGLNGAKGSHLEFYANFYEAHENNWSDAVSAGTSFSVSHLRATGSPLTSPIPSPTCAVASAFG